MEKPAQEQYFEEPRGKAILWAGILLPALAWAIHLNLSYSLVGLACKHGWEWPFHVISLAALILAATGIKLALGSWERAGKQWPQARDASVLGRSRFMAIAGLLLGSLFSLLILAQYIPGFFLNPCQ
jgi:hypothetical protein